MTTELVQTQAPSTAPELEEPRRAALEAIVMAGIASVPMVGHGLHAAISAYIQRTKEVRWHTFWKLVEDRLNNLDARVVDINYFSSMDFFDRIAAIHGQVTSAHDASKVSYLRNYIISCALQDAPDVSWRDLFLRHLISLTGSHLVCLQRFCDVQGHLSETERFSQLSDGAPFDIALLQRHLSDSWDTTLIEILVSDLEASGLVRRAMSRGKPEQPSWSITNTGIRLIKFVTEWRTE